jgi:hypothetical protein
MKGLGNDAKLVSSALDINTGITLGLPVEEAMGEEFPPDYFESMNEVVDDEDDEEEPAEKTG